MTELAHGDHTSDRLLTAYEYDSDPKDPWLISAHQRRMVDPFGEDDLFVRPISVTAWGINE